MTARFHRQDGVTLIELLVVILVILVLAGLLLGAITAVQRQAKRGRAIAEIAAIETALTRFQVDNGFYPAAAFIQIDTKVTPNIYQPDPRVEADDSEYKKASRALFLALWGQTQFDFNNVNNEAAQTANVRRYMDLKELQVADRDQNGGPLNASLQESYAIDPDAEADKSKFMKGSYIKDAFGNPYGYYFNPDATRRDAGKEPIKALYGKSIYDLWSTLGEKGGDQHVVSRWAHSWTEEL